MTAPTRNPAWAELVQLAPVLVLALPFIVQGQVDLSRATGGFLAAAALTIPVTAAVLWRGHVLNPILVGTAAWLWLGAIAFGASIQSVSGWLEQTQAFGLFVAALLIGVVTTAVMPSGYVGCRSTDAAWVRRTSLGLLGLTVVVVIWAWLFRHDIRLGGGLPFIVLNVTRRVLTMRAP